MQRDLMMEELNKHKIIKYVVFGSATIGMFGRALLFALLGTLLVRVAWQRDRFAAGFNDALNQLRENDAGFAFLIITGVCLIFFGIFSLLQVRYKNFLPYRDDMTRLSEESRTSDITIEMGQSSASV